jgi:hypothetical protein
MLGTMHLVSEASDCESIEAGEGVWRLESVASNGSRTKGFRPCEIRLYTEKKDKGPVVLGHGRNDDGESNKDRVNRASWMGVCFSAMDDSLAGAARRLDFLPFRDVRRFPVLSSIGCALNDIDDILEDLWDYLDWSGVSKVHGRPNNLCVCG